jgi:NifU-like protein involved in Fe-S cluster formation
MEKILEIKESVMVINDAKAHNPLCGDKVHIYLKLNKDKKLKI